MPTIFFLFIFIPLVELALIIKVGSFIGALPTIALIISSTVLGVVILRRESLRILLQAKKASTHDNVADQTLNKIIIALSGCLIVLPGFISSVIGLCGLAPPVRRVVIILFKRRLDKKLAGRASYSRENNDFFSSSPDPEPDSRIIEGEFKRVDKKRHE